MVGLEIPRVAGGLMIMALGEDGMAERVCWGNIDATFVHEDMVVILPVQEVRPEGGGDILQ